MNMANIIHPAVQVIADVEKMWAVDEEQAMKRANAVAAALVDRGIIYGRVVCGLVYKASDLTVVAESVSECPPEGWLSYLNGVITEAWRGTEYKEMPDFVQVPKNTYEVMSAYRLVGGMPWLQFFAENNIAAMRGVKVEIKPSE